MFTQGPWTLRCDRIFGAGNRPVADILKYKYPSSISFNESNANALLIAAALDLLEACQKLVEWVDGRLESEDGQVWFDKQAPFFQQTYYAARTAIIKAEGKWQKLIGAEDVD